MKLLVIDVGNTSASAGVFRNGRVRNVRRYPSRPPEPQEVELPPGGVEGVVIASVVPEANPLWEEIVCGRGLPPPLFVHHRLDLGVAVDYPRPERIGADRLANAAAAARLFPLPAVVCDFGTALTFDVVDRERGYVGGVICPGLPLMFDYLAEKTALLPHVKPARVRAVIGRNTRQAMQIGARLGYRGMVREILRALREELGGDPVVCCTGGYADWIFRNWDEEATIDPLLTLKGIGFIGERNLH